MGALLQGFGGPVGVCTGVGSGGSLGVPGGVAG